MLIKSSSGHLLPATNADVEKLQKFKAGKEIGCTIRTLRNGKFHRKVWALITYLYDHLPRVTGEYKGQKFEQSIDSFKDTMVILSGFHSYGVMNNGVVTYIADSISYENCTQEKIEQIYSAMINVALEKLGEDQSREDLETIVEQLLRFD